MTEARKPSAEWSVYINGRYVGTVVESTEEFARLAAISKYEPDIDAEIEVNRVRG